MDLQPVGIKYWGGWGDEHSAFSAREAGQAAALEEIMRVLKKYSRRDKEYIRDKWKKKYLFYAGSLLSDEDFLLAVNDNYIRTINKKLDL